MVLSVRSAPLGLLFQWITFLGDGLTLLVGTFFLAVLPWPLRGSWDRVHLCATALAVSLVNYSLKAAVVRPRPGELFAPLVHEMGWSFPSGHVMTSTCIYGFICYLLLLRVGQPWLRKAVALAYLGLIGLMCCSRLYLGAHYLGDVLGGLVGGWMVLSMSIFLHTPVLSLGDAVSSARVAPQEGDSDSGKE